LVGLDDTIWSYHAFNFAVNMINETGLKNTLYLLNVIEPIGLTQIKFSDLVRQELSDKYEERCRQILSFYGCEARKLGIEVKLLATRTDKSPTPRIINAARTYGVKCIIVGAGGGPRHIRQRGSNARAICELAPLNVIIVKLPVDEYDKMTEEGLHSLLDFEVPEEHFKEKMESDNFIHFQPVEDWLGKLSHTALQDISHPELIPESLFSPQEQEYGRGKQGISKRGAKSYNMASKNMGQGAEDGKERVKAKRNRNKPKDKNIPQRGRRTGDISPPPSPVGPLENLDMSTPPDICHSIQIPLSDIAANFTPLMKPEGPQWSAESPTTIGIEPTDKRPPEFEGEPFQEVSGV